MKIPVEISNRHVHLSRKDIDILFGKEYKLEIDRNLSQSEEFAAKEKVTLSNKDKNIKDIRVLGPEREETQIELAKTDAIHLNINAPIRESGNMKETPGITIKGPKGEVNLNQGVIIVQRHLHISEKQANEANIKDGQFVSIKILGERETIFNKVLVRVNPNYKLAVHLDTDEGNAANIDRKTFGELQ